MSTDDIQHAYDVTRKAIKLTKASEARTLTNNASVQADYTSAKQDMLRVLGIDPADPVEHTALVTDGIATVGTVSVTDKDGVAVATSRIRFTVAADGTITGIQLID